MLTGAALRAMEARFAAHKIIDTALDRMAGLVEDLASRREAAGYEVRAIANPLQDLTTDSEYVADYLKTIHGSRLAFPATVRRPGDVTA